MNSRLKTKVIYHGGSIPVPSHFQKGTIKLCDGKFSFHAEGKSESYNIAINIPLANIKSAIAEQMKYYSTAGYFLILQYVDNDGKIQSLELEIRSFGRRGRAQAISRSWAEMLSRIGS